MTSHDVLRAAVPSLAGKPDDYVNGWCEAILDGLCAPQATPVSEQPYSDWHAARHTAQSLAGHYRPMRGVA